MIKIARFCVNDALNDSFQDFTSKLTARAKEVAAAADFSQPHVFLTLF